MERFSPYVMTRHGVASLGTLVPANSFRVLTQDQLPGFIPLGLRQKCQGGLLMSSTTCTVAPAEAVTVNMLHLYRNDLKAGAVDKEPMVVALWPDHVEAGFLHHGDYRGRTLAGAPDLDAILDSDLSAGIQEEVPAPLAGPMSSLEGTPARKAWFHACRSIEGLNPPDPYVGSCQSAR